MQGNVSGKKRKRHTRLANKGSGRGRGEIEGGQEGFAAAGLID